MGAPSQRKTGRAPGLGSEDRHPGAKRVHQLVVQTCHGTNVRETGGMDSLERR